MTCAAKRAGGWGRSARELKQVEVFQQFIQLRFKLSHATGCVCVCVCVWRSSRVLHRFNQDKEKRSFILAEKLKQELICCFSHTGSKRNLLYKGV